MRREKRQIVRGYAQMWSREVFNIKEGRKKGKRLLLSIRELLNGPGIYVLYRDDHPYYVGKTKNPLFKRIWSHANATRDRYFNFWNFFSAFVVSRKNYIDELEGILIAAMPTANSASPKIRKIRIPREVVALLQSRKTIVYEVRGPNGER